MENYNWSDLEIGNSNLNHSEGYFTFKHRKHEKGYKEEIAENKENIFKNEIEDTAPTYTDPVCIGAHCSTAPTLNNDVKQKPLLLNPNVNVKKEQFGKNISTNKTKTPKNLLKTAIEENAKRYVKKKLVQTKAFSVCRYKDIYENKKKKLYNKIMEEEKKKRQFHSRPVPNFNKPNVKNEKLPEVKPVPITIPVTPCVLKREAAGLIRRRKLEQLNKQNEKDGKFSAREAKVLYEEPFVPKKLPHYVQSQPFNLNVEKRLGQRKQYDELYNKKLEEKQKQLEEEDRIRDENLVKELRKLTTFQARPNPFK